jgi:formylglycine-generating enzyme required for sulfatase activity
MFEKVLRAFAEGDLHYADVQLDLKRLLKSGASPQKLLVVLERWELIEPLPDYAHAGVLRLINEAIDLAEAQNADAAQDPIQGSISGPAAATAPVPAHPGVQDAEPASSPGDGGHPDEEWIDRENFDYQALSRAYEHARDAASVATARAIALAADVTAVRAALELERSKSREFYTALTERKAADAAARSRGEEMLRESQRYQAELRALRDSLEAHEKTLAQVRHSLGERDAQLAALQQEHASLVPAGQRKAQELDAALAEKLALHEAVVSQREEAQRETERYRAELRTVRDALAARDKTIAQVRHSLAERDAQLTALQQEHAKIVAALEARAKSAESELQAARKRYLEALETREWRRGFDQNRFREMDAQTDVAGAGGDAARAVAGAGSDAPRVAESQAVAPARPSAAPQSAPKAPRPSERAARIAPSPPSPVPKRGEPWTRGKIARAAGAGVAILVLVCAAWFFVHRASMPAKAPAVSSIAGPKPGTVIRDCPTCPGLTVLAAGRFKQGSAGPESGAPSFEKPLHWVVIARPFAMSTNAVTLDEYRAFITAMGRDMQGCDVYDGEWKHRPESSWENPGFVQTGSHPVTCASWDDAKAYAAWLSAQTGHSYRLPSASEWEYAARAGGEADQPWGANGSDACARANVADQSAARRYPGWTVFGCDDGFVYTAPVGSFKASAFGLNDMLGNVFQWTEDCWHEDYTGAPIDGSARTIGDCSEHELRGGSWFSTPAFVRADYRNHFAANYRTSSVGIRLVRDLAP